MKFRERGVPKSQGPGDAGPREPACGRGEGGVWLQTTAPDLSRSEGWLSACPRVPSSLWCQPPSEVALGKTGQRKEKAARLRPGLAPMPPQDGTLLRGLWVLFPLFATWEHGPQGSFPGYVRLGARV